MWNRHLNAGIKEKEMDQKLGSNVSLIGFPPKNVTYSCLQMNGKEVFRFAVRTVPQSIEAALQKARLSSSNIDWLLLHQVSISYHPSLFQDFYNAADL